MKSGRIPAATADLVRRFKSVVSNTHTATNYQQIINACLIWGVERDLPCTPPDLLPTARQFLDDPATLRRWPRAVVPIRAFLSWLAHPSRGIYEPTELGDLWHGDQRPAWDRALEISPLIREQLLEFDDYLLHREHPLSEHRRTYIKRGVCIALVDTAAGPHESAGPISSMHDFFLDSTRVIAWLKTARDHRVGRHDRITTDSDRDNKLGCFVYVYEWLRAAVGATADQVLAAIRKHFKRSARKRATYSGRPDTKHFAPPKRLTDRLWNSMALAVHQEAERCGYIPDDPLTFPTVSEALVVAMRLRAMVALLITSMMRLETLSTINLLTVTKGETYFMAEGVRRKITSVNPNPITNWVMFLQPWERFIEEYLHVTGRCMAIGMRGCSAHQRLGTIYHLEPGDRWGNSTAIEPIDYAPMWLSVECGSPPLDYCGIKVAVSKWVKRYLGKKYRPHDLRKRGATDALNEKGWPISFVMLVGQWESYETLLRIYDSPSPEEVFEFVGNRDYPSILKADDDHRRRALDALQYVQQRAREFELRYFLARSRQEQVVGAAALGQISDFLRGAEAILGIRDDCRIALGVTLSADEVGLVASLVRERFGQVGHPTDLDILSKYCGRELMLVSMNKKPPKRRGNKPRPFGSTATVEHVAA